MTQYSSVEFRVQDLFHQTHFQAEAPGSLCVTKLRLSDLTSEDHFHWAALSACAETPNIYAQKWVMEAALKYCDPNGLVTLFVVKAANGPWIGIIPLIKQGKFGKWPIANWMNWSATNQFVGTPLVARGAAPAFWSALLDHLDHHARGASLLRLSDLSTDDPVFTALLTTCKERDQMVQNLSTFHRAGLLSGDGRTHSPHALSPKAQSRLRNMTRRLSQDHGPIAFELLPAQGDVQSWIDHFLKIENTGWKKQYGSALACASDTGNLFRNVIGQAHDNGCARLISLSAGGKTLAMSSWLVNNGHGYAFKMAMDDHYRSYGPGRLLTEYIAQHVLSEGYLSFDSCTRLNVKGGSKRWPDERVIVDVAIPVGGFLRQLTGKIVLSIRKFRLLALGKRPFQPMEQ